MCKAQLLGLVRVRCLFSSRIRAQFSIALGRKECMTKRKKKKTRKAEKINCMQMSMAMRYAVGSE